MSMTHSRPKNRNVYQKLEEMLTENYHNYFSNANETQFFAWLASCACDLESVYV